MSNPKIIIDGFDNGILSDPTLQVRNGFSYGEGIDIQTKPGLLQVSQRLMEMEETTSPNDITDRIYWLVNYSVNNKLYGLGYSASGRIYDYDNTVVNKWALAHDDTNTCWGQGMIEFNGNLHWASNSYLGKFDGTTWTDSYKSINTDTSWHPMVIWEDKLYIGSGRYIDTLDESGTMTTNALTLPAGHKVRCLAVYGNKLMIGTWKGANFYEQPEASLFSWDGVTTNNYENVWTLKESGITAMTTWQNLLMVFAGASGNVYSFNGATLNKEISIPKETIEGGRWGEVYPGAVGEFNGNLIFGYTGSNSPSYSRIYQYGRKNNNSPFAITIPFIFSTSIVDDYTNIQVFALLATSRALYVAYYNDDASNIYKVDSLSLDWKIPTGAYWESQIYEIASGESAVSVGGVEIIANPIPTNNSIVIKYKGDNASSWTTLGTITSENQGRVLWGITGIAKTIQLRLEFTTTGGNNNTPQISTIKIY